MQRALKLMVKPGGAAERAGLQSGDILVGYNGQPAEEPDALVAATQATAGQVERVRLQVVRGAEILDLTVEPGALGVAVTPVEVESLDGLRRSAEGQQKLLDASVQPSRQDVRALAERMSAQLRDVAAAGGNAYQRALDQQDEIEALARAMPDGDAFLRVYAEELDACTNRTNDETQKQLEEVATASYNVQMIFGLIGFFAFLFIVVTILKN